MKHINTFESFLYEQKLFEIGEGSQPFPWKLRSGTSVKDWIKTMEQDTQKGSSFPFVMLDPLMFDFKGDKASYYARVSMYYQRHKTISFLMKPGFEPHKFDIVLVVDFDVEGRSDNRITNFGEQFRVITTVSNIFEDVIKQLDKVGWAKVQEIHIAAKLEDSEEGLPIAQTKRGRFYLEYIKKQGRRLPGDWSVFINNDEYVITRGKWTTKEIGKIINL